jgi:hypothetical protein
LSDRLHLLNSRLATIIDYETRIAALCADVGGTKEMTPLDRQSHCLARPNHAVQGVRDILRECSTGIIDPIMR